MRAFEWDEEKNRLNTEKHGVDFDLAKRIFNGPALSRVDDRLNYGEVRTIGIGVVDNLAVLTVVYTERSNSIRLISARAASRRERKIYYEKIY